MTGWWLAEFNVATLVAPIDAAEIAEFVAALKPINDLARVTPGFVWLLEDGDGGSSSFMTIPGIDDAMVLTNYTIWEDVDSLRHFVTRSGHSAYMRRRREWFRPPTAAQVACWWTPAGTVPPVTEAVERLEHLRAHGPSDRAWPLSDPRPQPA